MVVAIPLLFTAWSCLLIRGMRTWIRPEWLQNYYAPLTLVLVLLSVSLLNIRSARKEALLNAVFISAPAIKDDNANGLNIIGRISPIDSDAKVSSDWAGAIPYFLDQYVVDPLGKCDPEIAHMDIARDKWDSPRWEKAFYPGHMKWDAEYTFDKYKPEYMIFRWPQLAVRFKSILNDHYDMLPDPLDGVLIYRLKTQ